MQINWFTVIAQGINFLLLVWLLKRFLYTPILKAIDEREKKIAGQLQDADAQKAGAQKEQEIFKLKNENFDAEKKSLMQSAVAEVNKERQRLLDEAKVQADSLRNNMEKAAKENQVSQEQDLARKTKQQVFDMTRKALQNIASLSLEEQSVDTFIRRLNASKDDEKKQFTAAFRSNSDTILVRTAFDLAEKQQGEICGAVDALLGTKTNLRFQTTPGLIGGIELTTNGYKLAWSLSAYVDSLEKSIAGQPMENSENN